MPAAKSSTKKKPPTKPRTTVKKVRSTKSTAARSSSMKSFKLSKSEQSFVTLRPSVQTVYWLILSLAVLALGIWVVNLTLKVQDLYDQIDATYEQTSSMTPKSRQ